MEVKEDSPELLVWSGSTTVGQWAIQLGRVAGYKVITTASPKNHDLLKKLGATDMYDYKDETVPQKIAAKYPNLVSPSPDPSRIPVLMNESAESNLI